MRRREFLKLGVVAGGTVFLGGTGGFGARVAAPNESQGRPANFNQPSRQCLRYLRQGREDRQYYGHSEYIALAYGSDAMLLSEQGLAYHVQSFRGDEEKQILQDFALTSRTLTNNYQGL